MNRPLGLLSLCALACVVACGDDGNPADGTGSSTTEQGTCQPSTGEPSTGSSSGSGSSSSSSSGLDSSGGSTAADSTTGEPGDVDVTLQFAARVGDEPAACGTPYEDIGTAGTTIELLDIRLFVSNVRLLAGDGSEVPLSMTDDGEWQLEGSALLDFEDGSGGCTENTTAETNTTVRGTAPAGEYTGIRFDVGLPFEQNHLNADEAPPPLNTTAMFWSWASGYKFAKIDVQNDLPAPGNRWNLHLGSQGCDNGMGGPTVPPTEPCSRPGRPAISLTDFDPLTGTIVLDVAALFQGADVTADTPESAPGCMSFMPDATECTPIFENLGLDWATGDCADGCAAQVVFHGE